MVETMERIDRRKIEDLEKKIRNEYFKKLIVLIKPEIRVKGIELLDKKFGLTIRFMNQKYRLYFYYNNKDIDFLDFLKIDESRNTISLFFVLLERYVINERKDEYSKIIGLFKKDFKNWLYFDQLISHDIPFKQTIRYVRDLAYREKRDKFIQVIAEKENELRIREYEEKQRIEEIEKNKKEESETKKRMLDLGFKIEDIKKWDDEIKQWFDYIEPSWDEITGYNYRDYIEWYKAGFSAQETFNYKSKNIPLDESLIWKELEMEDFFEIEQWRSYKQTAYDVKRWIGLGFLKVVLSPLGGKCAIFYLDAGLSVDDYEKMLKEGKNPDEYIRKNKRFAKCKVDKNEK